MVHSALYSTWNVTLGMIQHGGRYHLLGDFKFLEIKIDHQKAGAMTVAYAVKSAPWKYRACFSW